MPNEVEARRNITRSCSPPLLLLEGPITSLSPRRGASFTAVLYLSLEREKKPLSPVVLRGCGGTRASLSVRIVRLLILQITTGVRERSTLYNITT